MSLDHTLKIIIIVKCIRSAIYENTSNGEALGILGESNRAF